MKKYEYEIITHGPDDGDLQEWLNQQGNIGYQLVYTHKLNTEEPVNKTPGTYLECIFMREKPNA